MPLKVDRTSEIYLFSKSAADLIDHTRNIYALTHSDENTGAGCKWGCQYWHSGYPRLEGRLSRPDPSALIPAGRRAGTQDVYLPSALPRTTGRAEGSRWRV